MTLAVLTGVALGAAATQGLHAQAKPKAYIVSESEVINAAALDAYRPKIIAAIQAAGGRRLGLGAFIQSSINGSRNDSSVLSGALDA
jgi:hypothetical protein